MSSKHLTRKSDSVNSAINYKGDFTVLMNSLQVVQQLYELYLLTNSDYIIQELGVQAHSVSTQSAIKCMELSVTALSGVLALCHPGKFHRKSFYSNLVSNTYMSYTPLRVPLNICLLV